jgi:hypothetical protein
MIYFAQYGTAWTLRGYKLVDRATGQYKATPTLAAGDFKIEKDGGASANLATLPTVEPSGGTSVSLEFSAAEMQCRQAVVTMIDAAGDEWSDDAIHIFTVGDVAAYMPFNLFSGPVALSPASQSAVVAAVWQANRADHTTPGTFGEGVASVQGGVEYLEEGAINELAFQDDAISARVLDSSCIGSDQIAQSGCNSIADSLLDRADAIETGLTPRGAMRLGAAADAGTLSGADTGSIAIKNALVGDKTRIASSTDEHGNRLAVTTDLT